MKRNSLQIAALALAAIGGSLGAYAQEHSKNFVHIQFPEEIKNALPNSHNAFAASTKHIYRINPADWTFEEVFALEGGNFMTQIQCMTTHGDDVFWYINGDGMYQMNYDGKTPYKVLSSGGDFQRNIEEAYRAMNIDPLGEHLVMYSQNENAAVFKLKPELSLVSRFDDHVPDAYWIGKQLWAGCLDKVVINPRAGRSENNNDFINMGSNDQTGLIKIFVNNPKVVPEMGGKEIDLATSGELMRFIYNKFNGDLLMCISDIRGGNKIYRVNDIDPQLVCTFPDYMGDFAAYGNKIVGRNGGGFVVTTYGDHSGENLRAKSIVTDLIQPKMWERHNPGPYEISGSSYMDYDSKGNLWIVKDRDLFIILNHGIN